ncbi:hypothetical protein OG548_14295 [Streptomyces sp. NBC_01356]|uniref:hypothetical protein n=1 Tax=Streptomyces sp. NBC_01356 TaxID=2903836 RepID=UPI002E312886|nr:hypothetical protein [Streptomyces sp. NBC_01356]
MTNQPKPGHRAVIQAAIEDWWITTDPGAPFHTPAVAEQIEMYLISSGYHITPDLRRKPMPTRRAIVTVILLAVVCVGSAFLAAVRGDWWWAALGLIGAGLLTTEAVRDISDRRHWRPAR